MLETTVKQPLPPHSALSWIHSYGTVTTLNFKWKSIRLIHMTFRDFPGLRKKGSYLALIFLKQPLSPHSTLLYVRIHVYGTIVNTELQLKEYYDLFLWIFLIFLDSRKKGHISGPLYFWNSPYHLIQPFFMLESIYMGLKLILNFNWKNIMTYSYEFSWFFWTPEKRVIFGPSYFWNSVAYEDPLCLKNSPEMSI